MFDSKPVHIEAVVDDEDAEFMFAIIGDIRRRRDSGESLDLTQISMLEWKLILIWDSIVESQERNLRVYSKVNYEAQQNWNELVVTILKARV